MSLHVIVGAGTIGTATARHLLEQGHDVRVITRRGQLKVPGMPVESVAADAVDPIQLTALTKGAAALYNCANPKYHDWQAQWPPLAASFLTAAERTGAVLVTMGNLYGYGPVDGPMTEDLPLRPSSVKGRIRADMWRAAYAAHQAGRIRTTEARASDFVGDGGMSVFSDMVAPAVRRGRPALAPVNFDVPHSLTYPGDAGRTLAVLGTDERAWGRVWHVPTAPAVSLREAATRLARLADAPAPRLRRMGNLMLRLGGLTNPIAREFIEMRYQFERPFVLDSSAAQKTFGLVPTPLDTALATLLEPANS